MGNECQASLISETIPSHSPGKTPDDPVVQVRTQVCHWFTIARTAKPGILLPLAEFEQVVPENVNGKVGVACAEAGRGEGGRGRRK